MSWLKLRDLYFPHLNSLYDARFLHRVISGIIVNKSELTRTELNGQFWNLQQAA